MYSPSWKIEVVSNSRNLTFEFYVSQGGLTLNGGNTASTTQIYINADDYDKTDGIEVGDLITIYAKENDTDSYFVLARMVCKKVELQYSLKKLKRVITGVDYNFFILSNVVSKKHIGVNFINVIQFYLEELNAKNSQAGLRKIELVEYPAARSDGSPFPNIEYLAFQKPMNVVLDELTTNKYTGDGNYDWWLDNSGGLHIAKSKYNPTNDISNKIIKSFVYNDGKAQIVNQVIMYCGEDLNGDPIYSTVFNASSIAMFGLHDRLEVYESLRNEIYELHKNDVPALTNEEFVDLVISRAKEKANDLLNSMAIPVESCEVTTYATPVTIYDKIKLPSFIPAKKELYVKSATHNLSQSEGWTTKINLTEKEAIKYG